MYLIKLQYSVLGILNIYICLTHWPLGVLLKKSFETSETVFLLLSGPERLLSFEHFVNVCSRCKI